MSAKIAIYALADRMAKYRQASKLTTGTTFWDIVDAAADATFENRVKGQALTDLDTVLTSSQVGTLPKLGTNLQNLSAYFANATTATEPGLGLSSDGYNAYLALTGMRMPEEFGETYYEWRGGSRLTPLYVFPRGTYVASPATLASAGMWRFTIVTIGTSPTFTQAADNGALTTTIIAGAPVLVINNSAMTAGTLTITVTLADGTTTHDIQLAGYSSTAQYTHVIAGEAAVASGVTAGDLTIASTGVLSAGHIIAGQNVLIYESDSLQEVFTVSSVTTNAVIPTAGMKNNYTSAAKLWPLYTNAIAKTLASSNPTSGTIDLYARPDRIIAL